MKIILAAAFAALTIAVAAQAGPRSARCVIDSSGARWEGPCLFEAERGGSFTVTPARGRSAHSLPMSIA